ncbi:MAG: glycosyltransferase [Nanopusillaceae archaeon]
MTKLGIYGTVYNSADTVRQTIEDLKKKLKYDFIISVCDNYSRDGTYEILKEYDFVDVFQKRSSRGLGRQYALEHLIKNYPDVDFIFYIDFDLIFFEKINDLIKGLINIYQEGSFYGHFASYDTYKELLKKVKWRDMIVAEDFMFDLDIIRAGFKLYNVLLPFAINQEREHRERKYTSGGLKYIKRMFNIYFRDTLSIKIISNIVRFEEIKSPTTILYEHTEDIILPPEIGLEKDYFLSMFKFNDAFWNLLKKKLQLYYDELYMYKFRSKSKISYYVILFYNYEKIKEYVKNFVKVNNIDFDENKIKKIKLR